MMATKRELREAASTLGKTLGVDVSTDGLNHTDLTALVERLEATSAERESKDAPVPTTLPPGVIVKLAPGEEPVPFKSQGADEAASDEPSEAVKAMRVAAEAAANPPDTRGRENAAAAKELRKEESETLAPPQLPDHKRYKYKIAPGHAIYCERGQLQENEKVRDVDFPTGVLAKLIKDGAVIELGRRPKD